MAVSNEGIRVEVNNYRVGKRISQGLGSSIYLAHNTSLDRPAFLEVLHKDVDEAPGLTSQFQERLEIVAQLKHDNIAAIHVTGITAQNQRYAAIEYVPGSTLAKMIESWTVVEALFLIRQLADALAVANAAGIIHHDLRPQNILIREDGRPFLIDLGSPIMSASPTMQSAGDGLDTFDYWSPEQIEGQPLTTQSNIYSLGVILYELLVGHRPQYRQSTDEREVDPETPELLLEEECPGLSEVTYRLVRNCLHPKAADRFNTMAELVAAVDVSMAAEKAYRRPVESTPQYGSWVRYVVAGGLLLLLTVAGFMFASRRDDTLPQVQTTPLEAGTFLTLQAKGTIEILAPAPGLEFAESDTVVFSWFWPIPLTEDEAFSVHLLSSDNAFLLGTVNKPTTGARYRLQKRGDEIADQPGDYGWQIILEDLSSGERLYASEVQTFRLLASTPLPTFGPTSTATPEISTAPVLTETVTATATAVPTATETPTTTPSPTPSCVPSRPSGWAPYTIKAGDYLSPLSILTGTSVERIMEVNCLDTVSLSIGQVLLLPGGGPPTPTSTPAPTPTTSSSGDGGGGGGGGPKPPPTPTPPR